MAISYLPILRIRNKPGVVGGREFDLIREWKINKPTHPAPSDNMRIWCHVISSC
jgi:hypothetical protein